MAVMGAIVFPKPGVLLRGREASQPLPLLLVGLNDSWLEIGDPIQGLDPWVGFTFLW